VYVPGATANAAEAVNANTNIDNVVRIPNRFMCCCPPLDVCELRGREFSVVLRIWPPSDERDAAHVDIGGDVTPREHAQTESAQMQKLKA
jgi:hypothetical protein